MDDHGSKKIVFNKASLLNLKAELLRKREEVKDKKHLPEHNVVNFRPASIKVAKPNMELTNKKSFKDSLQLIDTDELEAYRKTKLVLEEKAKIYEHLSDSAGNSKLNGRFLVDFNAKKQKEEKEVVNEPVSEPDTEFEPISEDYDDDSEWTEFTDCLGRTRKCLKSDLDLYLKQDLKLAEVVLGIEKGGQDTINPEPPSQKPFLVQKTNDYLKSLREKWEEKEKELLAKDQDIHYQDLLFDEARMHGVGYYAFSTDESERRKQMEALKKSREDTLKAQRDAETARRESDDTMQARAKAARARIRARAGLPPEEPKDNSEEFNAHLLEFLNKHREEADANAKEQENKIKEELEKERQKIREAFVREWDIGKDGVVGKVNKFRELTQEEYVEQQRDKRINEFAPPQSMNSHKSDANRRKRVETITSQSLPNKSWTDVRPQQDQHIEYTEIPEQKGLYFSSNSKLQNKLKCDPKYRNFKKDEEPVPVLIVNEVDDIDGVPIENEVDDIDVGESSRPEKRRIAKNHAEIEPPPTYEYFGPVPKHPKRDTPFVSDMLEAYTQGAKSLEPKKLNLHLSKEYDFTFD